MSGKDKKVYVGNLPPDIRSKDVEDLFYKYGKIVLIELKTRKGPPFAFIEFEDARYDQIVTSKVKSICPVGFLDCICICLVLFENFSSPIYL